MTEEHNTGSESHVEIPQDAPVAHSGDGEAVQPNAALASLSHWSFLIGLVVPFASLIVPLVLMNIQVGKEDAFVRENAKEALNLFIASFIALICCIPLIFIVIGIFLMIAIAVLLIIFPIIAACQTMSSTMSTPIYRYPMIFRLIK